MGNITITDVDFIYNQEKVLEDISLTIKEGSFTLIVGPNGAGKTTLLRLIGGLLSSPSGNIKIDGLTPLDAQKKGLLYLVPQIYNKNAAQFPATVEEVVGFGLIHTQRKDKVNKMNCIREALQLVHMEDMIHRRIGDLSGGQQQRVMLAQALARRPKYLLLDEPTSGIDFNTSEHIFKLLKELQKTYGITILLVTHDVNEAAKEAEEILCVNRHVCYYGDCQGFLNTHMHTALAWHMGG